MGIWQWWVSVILLITAWTAQAAPNTAEVQVTGANAGQTVLLSSEESHIVYEKREVPDTCYREVFSHYERECTNFPRQVCRNVPFPVCRDVVRDVCRPVTRRECIGFPPRQLCRDITETVCRRELQRECHNEWRNECHTEWDTRCIDVPRYRREAYACTKIIDVPVGTEVDFHVDAEVKVEVESDSTEMSPDETLRLRLNGAQLSLESVRLSQQFVVRFTRDVRVETPAPKQKRVTATYRLKLVPVKEILHHVDSPIEDLELTTGELLFTISKVKRPEFFDLKVYVGRQQFLIGDLKRWDGPVPERALTLEDLGDRTGVRMDLKKLGIPVFDGPKYHVRVSVRAQSPQEQGTVLNPSVLPKELKQELDKKNLKAAKE